MHVVYIPTSDSAKRLRPYSYDGDLPAGLVPVCLNDMGSCSSETSTVTQSGLKLEQAAHKCLPCMITY